MISYTSPISVVIPCYRCSGTIERALLSVINQTLRVAEIILIDDFSDDDTLSLLFHLQSKYKYVNINVVPQNFNRGPGVARNIGWSIATQPWIAFLDSDDIWDNRKIEIQYHWMQNFPNISLGCHQTAVWNDADIFRNYSEISPDKLLSPIGLLYKNSIPTRSVILRRSIPFRFAESRNAEDYNLWLEIAFSGLEMRSLSSILAYSFRPDSSLGGLSGNLISQEIQELRCYIRLFKYRSIGILIFLSSASFSIIKFLRRAIIHILRLINTL
jgi:glycosyltransferase involved in cell wall biosynthesis